MQNRKENAYERAQGLKRRIINWAKDHLVLGAKFPRQDNGIGQSAGYAGK